MLDEMHVIMNDGLNRCWMIYGSDYEDGVWRKDRLGYMDVSVPLRAKSYHSILSFSRTFRCQLVFPHGSTMKYRLNWTIR
jgi:hypothetical protein